jgi:hypothetical protein
MPMTRVNEMTGSLVSVVSGLRLGFPGVFTFLLLG